MNGIQIFNDIINSRLIQNTKFLSGRASYLPAYAAVFAGLKNRERFRAEVLETEGVTVPPILILSVTNDCNLSCRGCYACAQEREREQEMTIAEIKRIVREAVASGVGIIFLAGGEPLMKEQILDLPREHKDTLFVMFTNGLLIDEELMIEISKIRNLVPAFSIEGDEQTTDERRGQGVFRAVDSVMKMLDRNKVMFGASITLTRENYGMVMNPAYLDMLEQSGCRTLFMIEYVPCEGDPEKCLTAEQKEDLLRQVQIIQRDYNMLPVALPGDEEKFGGCLAAGRGFLHVSSTGNVEACPFAPFSDVNLKEMPFMDAMRSRMLARIRDNHHLLEEAEGGCALFENKAWVEQLVNS